MKQRLILNAHIPRMKANGYTPDVPTAFRNANTAKVT